MNYLIEDVESISHNKITLGMGLFDDISTLYLPSDHKLGSTHNEFHSMQLASFLVRDK